MDATANKRIFEALETFEAICNRPRNRRLYESLRDGLEDGMEKELTEEAFRIARDKGDGSPSYAAAVLQNWREKGLRRLPAKKEKPTTAQRLHIDQQEPEGELEDWEKDWLREIGFSVEKS